MESGILEKRSAEAQESELISDGGDQLQVVFLAPVGRFTVVGVLQKSALAEFLAHHNLNADFGVDDVILPAINLRQVFGGFPNFDRVAELL